MKLLTLRYKSGITRRCDARCYNGKPEEERHCVCNGANHGVGKRLAIENAREHWQKWAIAFAKKYGECSCIPASILHYTQDKLIQNEENKSEGARYISNHLDIWLKMHDRSEAKDFAPPEYNYIQETLWT